MIEHIPPTRLQRLLDWLLPALGLLVVFLCVACVWLPRFISDTFFLPPIPHTTRAATDQGFEMELTVSATCVEPNDTLVMTLTLRNTADKPILFAPVPDIKISSLQGGISEILPEYYWGESTDYPHSFPEFLLPQETVAYTWTWTVDPIYERARSPDRYNKLNVESGMLNNLQRTGIGTRLAIDYKNPMECPS